MFGLFSRRSSTAATPPATPSTSSSDAAAATNNSALPPPTKNKNINTPPSPVLDHHQQLKAAQAATINQAEEQLEALMAAIRAAPNEAKFAQLQAALIDAYDENDHSVIAFAYNCMQSSNKINYLKRRRKETLVIGVILKDSPVSRTRMKTRGSLG